MKKVLTPLAILLMPMLLFSCQKCYNCSKQKYCYTFRLNLSGDVHDIWTECFDRPQPREQAIHFLDTLYTNGGGEPSFIQYEEPVDGLDIEVCKSSRFAKYEKEQTEASGYVCIDAN